ncbi:hypothetical protein ACTFIW_013305 [Dictyostelium discoideum]
MNKKLGDLEMLIKESQGANLRSKGSKGSNKSNLKGDDKVVIILLKIIFATEVQVFKNIITNDILKFDQIAIDIIQKKLFNSFYSNSQENKYLEKLKKNPNDCGVQILVDSCVNIL